MNIPAGKIEWQAMHTYLVPSEGDVMGDSWSRELSQLWDRMRQIDSKLTRQPQAYALWQWAQCKMASMQHRVIASPQALAICGKQFDIEIINPLCELSSRILNGTDYDANQIHLF